MRARAFVLACGAIENARLLLAVENDAGRRLGGGNDWIGRCFMEHPSYRDIGVVVPEQAMPLRDLGRQEIEITARPSPAVQRENELVNALVFLRPEAQGADSEGVRSAKSVYDDLRSGQLPESFFPHLGEILTDLRGVANYSWRRFTGAYDTVGHFMLTVALEQAPNRESRVTLADTRDALGMPHAKLDWRFTDLDREALLRLLTLIGRDLGASGFGRLRLDIAEDGSDLDERATGSNHLMGTARMHPDPAQGVVDRNCLLHGTTNVYVTGSAVFPTAGASSPTYTIVALALKLSDHLREQYTV